MGSPVAAWSAPMSGRDGWPRTTDGQAIAREGWPVTEARMIKMIGSLASACSATSLYQFVWGLLLRGVNFGSGLVRPRQRRDNLRFAFEPDETAFAANQTYKMFQYLGQQITAISISVTFNSSYAAEVVCSRCLEIVFRSTTSTQRDQGILRIRWQPLPHTV